MDDSERKPINVSAERRYQYHPINTLLGSDDTKSMGEFKRSACSFMGKTAFSSSSDPKKRKHVYNPFTGRVVQQNTKSYYALKDLFGCPDVDMPDSQDATYLQKLATETAKREKRKARHGPEPVPLSKRSVFFEAKGSPASLKPIQENQVQGRRNTPVAIRPRGYSPINTDNLEPAAAADPATPAYVVERQPTPRKSPVRRVVAIPVPKPRVQQNSAKKQQDDERYRLEREEYRKALAELKQQEKEAAKAQKRVDKGLPPKKKKTPKSTPQVETDTNGLYVDPYAIPEIDQNAAYLENPFGLPVLDY